MTTPESIELFDHQWRLGEAIDFLRLIWAIDHALQRRSKAMQAAIGLTGPQRLLIRIIGQFPSIHATQLARILHLHPSSLTALVKKLERRGMVRRQVDSRDRRRVLLGLTRRGLALNRHAPGTVEAAVRRVLRSTDTRDLERVRSVLVQLALELER